MELAELLFLKPKSALIGTPKSIARQHKQDELIKILFMGHITFTEAARQLSIPRRTAYRYFQKWKEQEGLEIDREWWQLYSKLYNKNEEKAFEGLTRLKYRMTPDKIEVKETIKIEEKHVSIIADYTTAINRALDQSLQSLRAKQQLDTTESQATTT